MKSEYVIAVLAVVAIVQALVTNNLRDEVRAQQLVIDKVRAMQENQSQLNAKQGELNGLLVKAALR